LPDIRKNRFFRFLVSGVLNTAMTYCLYLILLQWLSYKISYTLTYLVGILLSYVLNRFFVFQEHRGTRTALLVPVVYFAQYLLSFLILWFWVDCFALSQKLAPLAVVILSLPMTYLLTRFSFTGNAIRKTSRQK
jgi:putative flippase GtrA